MIQLDSVCVGVASTVATYIRFSAQSLGTWGARGTAAWTAATGVKLKARE